MAQAAHTLKSHTNKDRQKEQQICVSLLHSLQERRQLGGMTGSPTPLKVLFLSLLFVFVGQVELELDDLEAGICDMIRGTTSISQNSDELWGQD